MGEEQLDAQSDPDFIMTTRVDGRVNGIDEVVLLNIGLQGALVEHVEPIRPGTILHLDLTLARHKIRMQCRAVRSVIHRRERQPDGDGILVYSTVLKFLGPVHGTR